MELRIRFVWDLPVDSETFEEIGRVIYYVASSVREMHLAYADLEGLEFLIKTDEEKALRDNVNELNREFKRVFVDILHPDDER